ncbi:beta strand repeat-containing protein [Actinokineospora sp.]|uniref:beta strand repeat-containing protein n=1 Tax=Actinokineospora sp. TaxID=1872133 RepID=UPI004037C03C
MQTWAKRGIQTALVTGGLLMLGTGIASADEDVNPDRPASALDGSITIPIKIDNNALATPFGVKALPEIDREIKINPGLLTRSVPLADRIMPSLPATSKTQSDDCCGDEDVLRGNQLFGHLVVPIDISGNAIAAGGDAAVENDSTQTAGHTHDITTDGAHSGFAGNVVGLDYALPVQITGNALAAFGTAETYNTATQSAVADGGIETDGNHGSLAGNILAGHFATPVQLNGNAVAGGGNATANSDTSSDATAGGALITDGERGSLAGNAFGVPVALPVQGNGNALSLVGISETTTAADAFAQAGDLGPNFHYITTNGVDGVLSGNVGQPGLAGPVGVNCNAATGGGIADALCETSGDATAGGGNFTNGDGGTGSGTIGHAPVALPTQGFGNAAAAIGNATADDTNTTTSSAGGDSYTHGDDSVLSGTVLEPSVASPIDLCGNSAAGGGQSDVVCDNTNTTDSGGYAGGTGNDSIGSGNIGTIPIAIPVEGLGNTGGAIGNATTTTTETKLVNSGGDGNAIDDAGTLAANVVNVPVAGPAQVFGNTAGAVANTSADSSSDSTITAGGASKAKGDGGSLAGNIAQAPIAFPVQFFANGITGGGHGETSGSNIVTSTAGDFAETSGEDGSGTGNIVSVPIAGAAQAFSDSVAAVGHNDASADSTTTSTAGGPATTSGAFGSLAGNVLSPQGLPLAQTFGVAGSAVGGQNTAEATNDTVATSGGDIVTTGDEGFLSGNLFDVPAAALGQAHGDAVAVLASESVGTSDNLTSGTVGGTSTTSGEASDLSGIDGTLPLGVDLPFYDVPIEILADAIANGTHTSEVAVGEESPQLQLPAVGGLQATELPRVSALPTLPGGPEEQARSLPVRGGNPFSSVSGNLFDGGLLDLLDFGSDDVTGGLLGGTLPTDGLSGGLPTNGLSGGLPTDGLSGGLPTDGLTDLNDILPTDGLSGGLPTSGTLPTDGLTDLSDVLPTGGTLPTGGLTDLNGGLPTDGLSGGLPTGGFADLTEVLPTDGLSGGTLPTNGLTEVLPTDGLSGGLPTGGVLPTSVLSDLLFGGLSSFPALPGEFRTLPAPASRSAAPVMPDLDTVTGAFSGDLFQVPSLDRLPIQTPALSGLDSAALPTDVAGGTSLTDTQSRLAGLFGQSLIG